MPILNRTALAEMTSEVVAAYVAKNSVPPADIPALISAVHKALSDLGQASEPMSPAEPLKPAVPIKKSVTDNYIISLEDGRKLKSMKRYLSGLGMTPEQYRTKWGLPSDYPTVAPAYARSRSDLARSLGLGRKRQEVVVEAAPEPRVQLEAPKKPRRGGGKRA